MTGEPSWGPLFERLLSQGLVGGVICMGIFILGLVREWWVMGTHFRAVVKDKDEYKALLRTAESSAEDTRKLLADLSERLP
jgi:hypothetical protein